MLFPRPFSTHVRYRHMAIRDVLGGVHAEDVTDLAGKYALTNGHIERGIPQDVADYHTSAKGLRGSHQLEHLRLRNREWLLEE